MRTDPFSPLYAGPLDRVLDFIRVLRRAGLRVSTSEDMDALRAVADLGFADREAFRAALAATLVKKAADRALFDDLFEKYWRAGGGDARALEGGNPLGDFRASIATFPEDLQPLLEALVEDDPARMQAEIVVAGEGSGAASIRSPFEKSAHTGRIKEQLNIPDAQQAMEKMARKHSSGGPGGGPTWEVQGEVRARFKELERQIDAYLDRLLREKEGRGEEGDESARGWDHAPRLLDKGFGEMTAADREALREIAQALARKLRHVRSLRLRRGRRGRLDVKRTVRASLPTGGIPFRLRYRKHKPRKPELVALLDLSGSVRYAADFLLAFLHALRAEFERMRAFVFVANLAEVTDLMEAPSAAEAVGAVMASRRIDLYDHSDFGRAFGAFVRAHEESVDRRTTVVVLGDARTNLRDPNAPALARIRSRAKHLLWLNPEPRLNWDSGDSVMRAYLPHCSAARECLSARQLAEAIEELAL